MSPCALYVNLASVTYGTVLAVVLGLLVGCSPRIQEGKSLTFPIDNDAVLFSASAAVQTFMTNQHGRDVSGITLFDASLMRDAKDLADSVRRVYVVFWDPSMGSALRGRYWQQIHWKDEGTGLPVMDIHLTPVSVLTVDSNKIVRESRGFRVGYAEMSVSSNDFRRHFVPIEKQPPDADR